MRFFTGVSKKELLDYIRLEETEDTAELLTKSSFLYVGHAVKDSVKHHYWSYPTPSDVAWVSFAPGEEGVLGTEVDEEVPQAIKDATAPREKHPTRKLARRPDIPVDRVPISKPVWVPVKQAPGSSTSPCIKKVCLSSMPLRRFRQKPSARMLVIGPTISA
jgi:hypothetical protein